MVGHVNENIQEKSRNRKVRTEGQVGSVKIDLKVTHMEMLQMSQKLRNHRVWQPS